jgi:hypothetical protein
MVRSGLPEGGGTLGIVNGSGQLIGVGPAHGGSLARLVSTLLRGIYPLGKSN